MSIDDGRPLIPGIDFILGRPVPVDVRLAFDTKTEEELREVQAQLGWETAELSEDT